MILMMLYGVVLEVIARLPLLLPVLFTIKGQVALPQYNNGNYYSDFRKMIEQKQDMPNNTSPSVNSHIKIIHNNNSNTKTIGAWTPNQMPLENMTAC